jgi:hypothetical protein
VTIVLRGVIFLGQANARDGQRDLPALGIAIGVVMAALAFMYLLGRRHRRASAAPHARHEPAR